ncbi:MAG: Hsp20/alpha crystallin family protein [Burkholderiales bacterium]
MANLVRWDPFQSFPRLHAFDDSFDDLLRRFGRSPTTRHDEAVAIAVDVSEDDEAYTVKAEIPGVKKEDIGVSVDGNRQEIGMNRRSFVGAFVVVASAVPAVVLAQGPGKGPGAGPGAGPGMGAEMGPMHPGRWSR